MGTYGRVRVAATHRQSRVVASRHTDRSLGGRRLARRAGLQVRARKGDAMTSTLLEIVELSAAFLVVLAVYDLGKVLCRRQFHQATSNDVFRQLWTTAFLCVIAVSIGMLARVFLGKG